MVNLIKMKTIRTIIKIPENAIAADIVEWRADLSDCTIEQIKQCGIPQPLLYTNHGGSYDNHGGSHNNHGGSYNAAIESGAFQYVDFDVDSPEIYLVGKAKDIGLKVIVSYHDYEKTPAELKAILDSLKDKGADIVKLVVTPHRDEDLLKLKDASLGWRKENPTINMIIIARGKKGLRTRTHPEEFGSDLIFDLEPKF